MNKYYLLSIKFVALTVITYSLLLITYSSVLAQDASEGATESVRDKVRKTIENLVKKPKSVVGTLDSIADSTLKIKGEDGKVILVATNPSTKYVKTTNGKSADIKFADLAIGDFIAALGYKNGNDILDSERVLAYDEAPYPKKQAMFGTVETNKRSLLPGGSKKGTLTIKLPKKDEVWTVETSSSTKVTKKVDPSSQSSSGQAIEEVDIDEVEEGDRVVVAGSLNEKKTKTVLASQVFVVPGKAEGQKKSSPKPSATPKASPKASPKPSPTATPAL